MSYEEKRVRVSVYGALPSDSPLLVDLPGSKQRLHKLTAAALVEMANAFKEEVKVDLVVASGWRPHRWKSREDYEWQLIHKYHYKSVKEGQLFLAFDSPHETGLAVDFGCGGLEPKRSTIPHQRKTRLHEWLVNNADRFGFHPYKEEPWHWEYPLSLEAYKSGELPADHEVGEGVCDAGGDGEEHQAIEADEHIQTEDW